MADAPVLCDGAGDWLLKHAGDGFVLLAIDCDPPVGLPAGLHVVQVSAAGGGETLEGVVRLIDVDGAVAARYGAGRLYLVRPDQHIAAVFEHPDAHEIAAAMTRAMGRE